MKVLFLGDIFGRPGRNCIAKELQKIKAENDIDLTIANGENAAGGIGINPNVANDLFEAGIDVLTSGNHIFKKKEIYEYIESHHRLLKPANYPPVTPGRGFIILNLPGKANLRVAVINICGRVFIENLDCPFRKMDELVAGIRPQTNIIIVDFHAEVTSEKVAMGWYLDGRVSAVIGTHTHVQTADERILPRGTAYISDAGMVGPRDSVIGVKKELIIQKFLTMMPITFVVASEDNWINGVIIDINESTGKAVSIKRISCQSD
jgi:2',3'-cyclic-nucleotide 2'-phosphodiesterase